MSKVRVGVVGVGALGQHHARVYAQLPQAELVGVVDTHPGRAEEIAVPLGTTPFHEYRQLFGKVDVVSIATPTILHAPIALEFLNEGIHVLVEKPICHSMEGASRMIEVAEMNGRVLQVGHLERYNPAVRAARQFTRSPRFFEAHRMGLFSPRSLDIDVVLDLMIHDLDIISLLVPSDPVQVNAVGIAILTRRIDIANARITFADGCVANVTASRVSTEKIRKLRYFHSREYVSIDYTRQQISIYGVQPGPGSQRPEIVSRKIQPPRLEPLEEELKSFLAATQSQGPVGCTGQEGARALSLALQILEQAEKAQALEFDTR